MNLKKLGRTLGIVVAVAMLAMVLQGCGGDDGISATDQARIDNAETAAADAAAAQAEADAAAAAAAQAKAEADAAASMLWWAMMA